MTLAAAWTDFSAEFDILSNHFRNFAANKTSVDSANSFSMLDECILEGLLSRSWQAWCGFCRTCVIASCVGTTNNTGALIPALPQAISESIVSGAAIRAKSKRSPPYWGSENTLLRAEPTWGDVDVLVKILTRLSPSNAPQLLAAFSAGSPSAKAVQLIRNGAAHNNSETRAELERLQSAYVVFAINHPTQALFWIEPNTRDFLITNAIATLQNIGLVAIS
jgi:hypothetical protein